jgi:hypothetical protein
VSVKGLLAGFESEEALSRALDRLAAAELGHIETFTPTPLNESSSPGGSPLPLVMFIAGMLGFVGFFLFMTYADVHAYPLDIGGRPKFAWPAFVPIAFELGVLCAMGVGFFGYFVKCRMPQLYDPIDECETLKRASRDGWFVALRSCDIDRLAKARELLLSLQPVSVEEFPE